jgi:hypothetical protein
MNPEKTFDNIIKKEVDKIVNNIPSEKLLSILQPLLLQEDNKIINSLRGYIDDFDYNNQITVENWNWFKDVIKNLAETNSRFQYKCKEVCNKLYAVKYFTKLTFVISENAEEELKFELKNHFKHILYEDINQFIDAFFSLPFEFVGLVVRYLSNILTPKFKPQLTTNYKDANIVLKTILKKKNDFILNINKISLGQADNISIAEAGLLLDVKAFFEYNALNNGALEYLLKLLNSQAKNKLKDIFGDEKIAYMKSQILAHPSYLKFLKEVKDGTELPFFTKDGFQNTDRKPSYDEFVKKYYSPEEFIPKKKEEVSVPKPILVKEPKELEAKQPSGEELIK